MTQSKESADPTGCRSGVLSPVDGVASTIRASIYTRILGLPKQGLCPKTGIRQRSELPDNNFVTTTYLQALSRTPSC